MLTSALILIYSLVFVVLAPLLRLAAALSPRLKAQLAGRDSVAALSQIIAPARAAMRRSVVFFCSSAGEYEQARPLIERVARLDSVYVQVIFFSKSGLDFVRARGETLPCCLSPTADSVWQWGWLFAALRPDVVVVVRHELWPGFLDTARHYAKLYLIDASRSLGESRSPLKRLFRAQLLRFFDGVFTVSDADQAYFRERYGLRPERLHAVGDTKYDRVRERALAKAAEAAGLAARFDLWAPALSRRLVLGSAYRHEVALFLAARDRARLVADRWQVVIVPHVVTPEVIGWIRDECRAAGLQAALYSQLATAASPPAEPIAVVVLDAMGMLAEVYGTADAAFIGGALHHQVHNVLEPACHGLALAFGPFYKNSQEAVHLVEVGLARVVDEPAAFADWWGGLEAGAGQLAPRMVEAVAQLTGASDRIMATWRPLLEL